jgi:hypothetical protein
MSIKDLEQFGNGNDIYAHIAEKDPEPRWPRLPLHHQEWFDTPGGIKVYVKLYEKLNHLIPTS